MKKQIYLADESSTVTLGHRLADMLSDEKKGLTVYLEGTLGAGKTTFCRGVLQGFGHSSAVKSPTYTLVEPYEFESVPVYHFDLYRLADPEELEYMGIRDYFSGACLCLVEWPSRGEGILPAPDITLHFDVSGSGRTVNISADSEFGIKISEKWA